MHGNMVFSTHYILGTPQQSGGFLVCSVKTKAHVPLFTVLRLNHVTHRVKVHYVVIASFSLQIQYG